MPSFEFAHNQDSYGQVFHLRCIDFQVSWSHDLKLIPFSLVLEFCWCFDLYSILGFQARYRLTQVFNLLLKFLFKATLINLFKGHFITHVQVTLQVNSTSFQYLMVFHIHCLKFQLILLAKLTKSQLMMANTLSPKPILT